MAVRVLALATVVALGLSGLAQSALAQSALAQAQQGGPAQAPRSAEPQANPRPQTERRPDGRNEGGPAERAEPRAERAEPRAERSARAERPRAERPRARAERRPRDYRSARYGGGRGASWRTGQDAYGFAGSYGGCRFRGHAGPNGYRLDRSC